MKKGLLIGINYEKASAKHSNISQLSGCVNDTLNMANILMDAFDYDKSNITILRDDYESHDDFLPTRINILNRLIDLRAQSKQCNEICIYYSGHGYGINDTNGDELSDNQDEIIIPCDVMENGFIIDDDINLILSGFKCPVILFFDCCNSGTVCDLTWKYDFDGKNIKRTYQGGKGMMENKHIYMMSGCRDNQVSMGIPDYEYNQNRGAFSRALGECLRFNKHHVSLLKLYMDICIYMQSQKQKPCFSSSSCLPSSYFLSKYSAVNDGKEKGNINYWGDDGEVSWNSFYTPAKN